MIRLWIIALCLVLTGCPLVIKDKAKTNYNATVELVVLGNVQDAGSPHIGCIKPCCEHLHESPDQSRKSCIHWSCRSFIKKPSICLMLPQT